LQQTLDFRGDLFHGERIGVDGVVCDLAISRRAALPALSTIPSDRGLHRRLSLKGHFSQQETFRRLRTNIYTLIQEQGLKTLLVASAGPREGKSTVLANLAVAIGQSGRQVVAVDADLRRPSLHNFFRMSNAKGLSGVLAQTYALNQALQHHRTGQVWVLPSGAAVPDPPDLLAARMPALIEELALQFDVVLLDSPALLAVTDGAVLAPMVDGVLLVVGSSRTEEEAVRAACRQLADVKARVIGLVVNLAKPADSSYYGKYYEKARKPQD
jgi:capsular exopolysaccharide synthesis family protein